MPRIRFEHEIATRLTHEELEIIGTGLRLYLQGEHGTSRERSKAWQMLRAIERQLAQKTVFSLNRDVADNPK